MVKMGTMCLYGCRRISTGELWDMSSFLLILTAFSWFLLEQLLGLAVMCALINSYHVMPSVPGTLMDVGSAWVTLCCVTGGQCGKKSSRPRLGSQLLIHQLRDVTGLLTSLGLGSSLP